MERLSGLDAAFLAFDGPAATLQVGAALVIEHPADQHSDAAGRDDMRAAGGSDDLRAAGRPDDVGATGGVGDPDAIGGRLVDGLRHVVDGRLHLVPALRRRVVRVPFGLHHPVWVEDPAFDLDYHLRRASLPAPGGPRELAGFVADVAGRPLDPDRPLWELHVVEGLDGGHAAVVAKIHHAAADGEGGLAALAALLDAGPGGRREEDDRSWQPEAVPAVADLVAGAITTLLREPPRLAGALAQGAGVLRAVAGRNRRLREEDEVEPPPLPFRAPATSVNGTVSAHRRYGVTEVALSDMRAVTRAFGGTVNDVLLAGAAGALRRLLASRGDQLTHPLVALVPLSTRGAASSSDATAAGSGQVGPANRVSAMLTSLATSVADPVERLRVIAAGTRLAKEQARLVPDGVVSSWAELVVPALSGRLARLASNLRLFDHVPPPCNVVVSNIRGPDQPLWLAGDRVVGVYPFGPVVDGVGLNVTAVSYLGVLHVGVLACRDLVPEVEDVAHQIGEEIAALAKAAARAWGHPG